MQFTTLLLSTLLTTTTTLAAPTPATASKSAVADVPQWTLEAFQRVCDAADTSCTWSFTINTHLAGAASTPCSFVVKAGAKPASHTDSAGNACGKYTVGSGWSDQFGPENGFTTLSLVDNEQKLITWPSYTDKALAGGAPVTPDLSWPPTQLTF
ncbi:small secreted protein [Hypoxylon fragiforme]|uniref:small secreted protein n=1 Tax=Hypoxylon fragiforme TaxID=63214 RepID=UPI0020C7203F|nr:small secreted protein [Hypoxylon fragiforme]KAI2610343.1 small secreted protein [Hypoxylon fragiforme]